MEYGLGGRATIDVCEQCNSTIGHEIEGPMMAHDQVLNLARVVHLARGQALRGRVRGEDRKLSYDLLDRQARSKRPVRNGL